MEKIIPLTDLPARAKPFIEEVRDTGEAIIITPRGRPAAILLEYKTYQGMVATIDEMSYPERKHA